MKLGNTNTLKIPGEGDLVITDLNNTLGCLFYEFYKALSPHSWPPGAVPGVMDPWGMQTWSMQDSFKSSKSDQVWLCPRGDSQHKQIQPPACQHPLHWANVASSTGLFIHLFLLVSVGHTLQWANRTFHTFSSKPKISGKLSEHPVLFTRPDF